MKPGPELPLRAAARLSVWASFIPPTPCCVNAHILLLPAPERRNGTMEDKKKTAVTDDLLGRPNFLIWKGCAFGKR